MKGGDKAVVLKNYSATLGLNLRDPSIHNSLAKLYVAVKDEKLRD